MVKGKKIWAVFQHWIFPTCTIQTNCTEYAEARVTFVTTLLCPCRKQERKLCLNRSRSRWCWTKQCKIGEMCLQLVLIMSFFIFVEVTLLHLSVNRNKEKTKLWLDREGAFKCKDILKCKIHHACSLTHQRKVAPLFSCHSLTPSLMSLLFEYDLIFTYLKIENYVSCE